MGWEREKEGKGFASSIFTLPPPAPDKDDSKGPILLYSLDLVQTNEEESGSAGVICTEAEFMNVQFH
jgi:hypothetical protein